MKIKFKTQIHFISGGKVKIMINSERKKYVKITDIKKYESVVMGFTNAIIQSEKRFESKNKPTATIK